MRIGDIIQRVVVCGLVITTIGLGVEVSVGTVEIVKRMNNRRSGPIAALQNVEGDSKPVTTAVLSNMEEHLETD